MTILLYKYRNLGLQEFEDEELATKSTLEVSKEVVPLAVSEEAKSATEIALEEADKVLGSLDNQTEYVQQLVAEKQRKDKLAQQQEQAAIDWEISEIQKEIAEERKKWDGVYSDEEGDGAESEAIFKDQKRRNDVLQAVLDEVQKTNKK